MRAWLGTRTLTLTSTPPSALQVSRGRAIGSQTTRTRALRQELTWRLPLTATLSLSDAEFDFDSATNQDSAESRGQDASNRISRKRSASSRKKNTGSRKQPRVHASAGAGTPSNVPEARGRRQAMRTNADQGPQSVAPTPIGNTVRKRQDTDVHQDALTSSNDDDSRISSTDPSRKVARSDVPPQDGKSAARPENRSLPSTGMGTESSAPLDLSSSLAKLGKPSSGARERKETPDQVSAAPAAVLNVGLAASMSHGEESGLSDSDSVDTSDNDLECLAQAWYRRQASTLSATGSTSSRASNRVGNETAPQGLEAPSGARLPDPTQATRSSKAILAKALRRAKRANRSLQAAAAYLRESSALKHDSTERSALELVCRACEHIQRRVQDMDDAYSSAVDEIKAAGERLNALFNERARVFEDAAATLTERESRLKEISREVDLLCESSQRDSAKGSDPLRAELKKLESMQAAIAKELRESRQNHDSLASGLRDMMASLWAWRRTPTSLSLRQQRPSRPSVGCE